LHTKNAPGAVNFKEHNLETNDSLQQERRMHGAAGQAVG